MKKLSMLLVCLLCAAYALAQVSDGETHEFRKIQDDPYYVSDKLIALELCGPLTFSSHGSLTLGVGANGLWGLNNKMEVQGNFNFNFVQFNGGPGILLEGGPALTLSEKSKEDEVKVVLKYSERSYDTPTHHVKESSATWLESTATYLSKFKVRGGPYLYKTTYENEKKFNYGPLPYTMLGVYGGLEFSKQGALISEVDGVRGITSGLTRVYVDGFVLPVRSFGADSTHTIRDSIGGGIFGGRLGFQAYFNPNKSKRAEPRMVAYQVWPTLFFKSEVGYRPAEGVFFSLGAGLIIWKNR
jgi:hypothetical protein